MPPRSKPIRAWLITCHAPILPQYGSIAPEDMIIAVDQGLEIIHLVRLRPTLIIGDLDSLSELSLLNEYGDVPLVKFSPDKNETDSELAMNWAISHGATEIIICNDMEGRIDHAIGLIPLLDFAKRQGVDCRIETGTQILRMLEDIDDLDYPEGTLISLLPLSEDAEFSSSVGLQYSLDGLVLKGRQTRGISNRLSASPARILKSRGDVLAVITIL